MTPLNFLPDAQGVMRASARGFEYRRWEEARSGTSTVFRAFGTWSVWRASVNSFTDPRDLSETGSIELCQAHADAVEQAVEDETKGLRELLRSCRISLTADYQDADLTRWPLIQEIDAALKGKS